MLKGGQVANSLLLVMAMMLATVPFGTAHAANLDEGYVRLDRLKAGVATGGTVCANPTTAGTEASVEVAFPAGFTVDGTAANWTVSTTNLPTGSTAWPSIDDATDVTSQKVTFPGGDLTPGTLYCFNFAAALTNASAGNDKEGVITTQAAGATTIDNLNYALSTVTDDQIVVSAVVPPTFSFALGGNSDTFTADLSTTTTSTAGNTASVSTNADNGWITWVKSANSGLDSASAGQSIATAGSLDDTPTDLASATGYVLDVNATTDNATGTGTLSIADEYNGTNTTSGGTLSDNFQTVASSDGTTAGDVITLIERAKISAIQAAANDYTDTLTVVAAGLF